MEAYYHDKGTFAIIFDREILAEGLFRSHLWEIVAGKQW